MPGFLDAEAVPRGRGPIGEAVHAGSGTEPLRLGRTEGGALIVALSQFHRLGVWNFAPLEHTVAFTLAGLVGAVMPPADEITQSDMEDCFGFFEKRGLALPDVDKLSAKVKAEYLLATSRRQQPDATGTHSTVKGATLIRTERLARALLLVKEHPEWSDREIAARAGYKSHSNLVRNKIYQAAAGMARGEKTDLPHGTKDGKSGSLEAWKEDK